MEIESALLSPWATPHSPDALAKELKFEVAADHPLFSKSVKAVAIRVDRDDVLFEVVDGAKLRYALVHLTWIGKVERNVNFPLTQFFDSLAQWLERMKADHEEYNDDNESSGL